VGPLGLFAGALAILLVDLPVDRIVVLKQKERAG